MRRRGAGWTLASVLVALHFGAARAETVFDHPFPMNTSAITDGADDFAPQVTTDGLGTWVAVWVSLDSLGDTFEALSDCARASVRCSFCASLNQANHLGIDCDDFDDGIRTGSCSS